MDDIIKTVTRYVEQAINEEDGAADSILTYLDYDPGWDTVNQIIGGLAGTANAARWAIGEVLVFLRYRANHTTVATFEWDGESVWPDELFKFVKDKYNYTLSPYYAEIVEFLAWTSYRYPRFWLLVKPGEIRVWQKANTKAFDDEEYEAYIRKIGAALQSVLDENTLLSYYYTAACFPRSQQIPHVSWTAHYEVTNRAGGEVPDNLRGRQRLEAKAPIAQKLLRELDEKGKATVSYIRSLQRTETQKKKWGYTWQLPPIPCLMIIDEETGEKHVMFEFQHQGVAKAILYYVGLILERPQQHYELYMDGGNLEFASGEMVAICPDPTIPVVEKAMTALANKMKWKVKR